MLKIFLFLFVGAQSVGAFLSKSHGSSSMVPSTVLSAVMTFDDMVSRIDHYEVTIPKPLGVVFGENPDPYLGLVVDDVSEGLNGGRAGLRKGDQLLAVDENVVVGKDFDSVMDMLRLSPKNLNLVFFRGPASQMFTVLANQLGDDETLFDDEDEGEEESEEVIMDENYESPVRIEVKEQKPLSAGDFVKAFGKLGSMLGESVKETLTANPNEGNNYDDDAPPPPKKNTGFFGMGGDTVQLDGNEARGFRKEKIEPDEF